MSNLKEMDMLEAVRVRNSGDYLSRAARWAAVAIGLSIPVSTALDNTLLFIVLVTGLLSAIFWQQRSLIRQNPVAMAALFLCALLVVGSFYGAGTPKEALNYLGKYADIWFIALLLPLFAEPRYRRYGLLIFMMTMALTLLLSFLIWLGVFEGTRFFADRLPDNPVVFKLHITHGILMAFAAYLFAIKAYTAQGKWRVLLGCLALLASFNVLFMVQGRTGYLVLGVLGIYFTYSVWGQRGLWSAAAFAIGVSMVGYAASPTLRERVGIAVHEIQVWQPRQGHNEGSSMGTRLDYYTNTLKVIANHPFAGVGTGGFEKAYGQEIAGTAVASSNNPHNQYLLFTAQLGPLGLVAFLYLLITQWRAARYLPTNDEYMLARGLVLTIAVGSLFNSLLLDHAEGLFYAWASGLLFAGYRTSTADVRASNQSV